MNQMKSEDKQSELQVKQKQLDELLAVQRQLEEEKKTIKSCHSSLAKRFTR